VYNLLILLLVGHGWASGIALTFADGSESAEPVSAADLLPPEAPLVGPVGGPANSRNNNYGLHPILRTLAVPFSALGTTEQLRYSTDTIIRSLARLFKQWVSQLNASLHKTDDLYSLACVGKW
jgi:hypothetical protein